MNIKEAKELIKNSMTAYFSKDRYGNYEIPPEKQRPVFLMGPPGIGKTAIMEQIAQELDVGLVSYSMTHHTRQSALGLPYIEKKVYGGIEYSVSEYTMSEIIASVYDMMESTGKREGILFLDEINCVSETLNPAMLQFLQYKIFGRHRVPEGWIVVTAGNPPEYNNSVHDFDIVTWDRLKRIDVEPDHAAWKEYAYKKGIHAAVLTYLDVKKSDFYRIETTVDGKSFVTARGWSDLSDMITLCEKNGITVDERLIAQYVQHKKIAKDFAVYYDLFNKYRSDYQVENILGGNVSDEIKNRAKAAKFDERLALLGLLLDAVSEDTRSVYEGEMLLTELMNMARDCKGKLNGEESGYSEILQGQVNVTRELIRKKQRAGSIAKDKYNAYLGAISVLESIAADIISDAPINGAAAFEMVQAEFYRKRTELKESADLVGNRLENVFSFCEEIFGEGQELLILVTELTVNFHSARFISRYGCSKYFEHNKELLFHERHKEIITQIQNINSDEDLT